MRTKELHESWQARVYMRVSSTLVPWSNESNSCMRVDKREFTERFINSRALVKREQELHESWQARVYMRVSSTLMSWSSENKSCMRVDKRDFTWEFHQLSCLGQTRTRELPENKQDVTLKKRLVRGIFLLALFQMKAVSAGSTVLSVTRLVVTLAVSFAILTKILRPKKQNNDCLVFPVLIPRWWHARVVHAVKFCTSLKAAFHLRVFHTSVYARKSWNRYKFYSLNN